LFSTQPAAGNPATFSKALVDRDKLRVRGNGCHGETRRDSGTT
jgi:hypothetical protein